MQIHSGKLNIEKTSRVGGEDERYKLHIGGYRGDAGDSMAGGGLSTLINNGMKFSTRDRDNDKSATANCAHRFNAGGWWFNA